MNEMISIIVPVYNMEKFLGECITSMINQTYQDLEILLIDDGSSDKSGEICDAFAQKDARIRVIHKENGGVSAARNLGIAEARGKYIGFVDADDCLEPQMYENLLQCMQRDKAQLAIVDCYVGKKKDQENEIESVVYDRITAMKKMILGESFAGQLWNKLFLAENAKKIKLDETISMYEDLAYVWDYLKQCEKVSYLPKPLYFYRQNENSVSHEPYNAKHDTAFVVLKKILNDTKQEYPELYETAVAANMLICCDFSVIEMRDRYNGNSYNQIKEFRKKLLEVYDKKALQKLPKTQRGYIKALKISAGLFQIRYRVYPIVFRVFTVGKRLIKK